MVFFFDSFKQDHNLMNDYFFIGDLSVSLALIILILAIILLKKRYTRYKTLKQWSWVLKQGDWLEMISIYLTLVWFEVLYQDPDSRNNEIFQANVT